MWPHAKASSPDLGLYAKGPTMRHVTYLSVLTYFPNNTALSGRGKDRISRAASQMLGQNYMQPPPRANITLRVQGEDTGSD